MTFSVTDRWGGSDDEPSVGRMSQVLADMEIDDLEHTDAWLHHDETGWTLATSEDERLVWENLDLEDPPRHMTGVSRERVLELWIKLSQGRIAEIDAEPWLAGDGAQPMTAEERAEIRSSALDGDRRFYDSLGAEQPDEPCRRDGCTRGRVAFSILCRVHQFEQVRRRPSPFLH